MKRICLFLFIRLCEGDHPTCRVEEFALFHLLYFSSCSLQQSQFDKWTVPSFFVRPSPISEICREVGYCLTIFNVFYAKYLSCHWLISSISSGFSNTVPITLLTSFTSNRNSSMSASCDNPLTRNAPSNHTTSASKASG